MPEAPGERRHITVLFSDLVGSTDLASSMDVEDWHDVLDSYQHRVAAAVAEHGGVISQFQGDGAVAYFGYPEAVESAGRDAVNAGLAVVDALQGLSADLPGRAGMSELRARVGIHSGEVVMAAIRAGGADRIADVFGEVPNLAARLQAAGQPGEVIISDTTADIVAGYFVLEGLGELDLKGISRPVPAFRVLRRSAARRRMETGPLTGFVARASESAWLQEQWSSVRDGPARTVLITGEAGIGKSRLLQEFTASLIRDGVTVAPIYCGRRDTLSPLRPFGPLMGEVPRTPDVAARWVLDRTAEGPALLLVEDAHWADPSTIEAVEQISRSRQRVLVALTARPDYEEPASMEASRHLSLDRLSPEEALAVVSRVPGGASLPVDVRRDLVNRADGVPLYLEELARGAVQRAADPESAPGIPATLTEVISARLGRLGDARPVAQLASIVGRAFERDVLREVSGLDPAAFDAQLRHLVEQAVVEPSEEGDGRLWFRHALIHEAAYRSVLRPERRRAHSLVADTLLRAGRADGQPEVVAFHLGAAGRPEEATVQWRRAARTARRHARFREAAGHERELLALIALLPDDQRETIELGARGRLTMCLTAVDQSSPEAIVEGRRAQELARRLGDDRALLRSYLVLLPWWQANADYGAIDDALPEANALASALADAWAQQTLAQYTGAVRVWQGRPAEGVAQLEVSFATMGLPLGVSLATVAPQEHPAVEIVLASTRIAAALGCWLSGRVDEGHRIQADTLRFVDDRSVPQARAVVAATAAIMAQLDGDRALVAALTAATTQVGDEVSVRQWQQWGTVLRWWSGHGEEEPEVPGPLLRPYFLMLLADRPEVPTERALHLLEEARKTLARTGERFCEAEVLRVLAAVRGRAGDHDGAARALTEAIAVARAQRAPVLELRAWTDVVARPDAPAGARDELAACVAALSDQTESRALQRARAAVADA